MGSEKCVLVQRERLVSQLPREFSCRAVKPHLAPPVVIEKGAWGIEAGESTLRERAAAILSIAVDELRV
jgi:hypothetical protein